MHRVALRFVFLSPLALALACSDSSGSSADDTDGGASSDGGDDPRISYYGDVLPLLNEHCGACHQPGGLAPFSVGDLAETKQWADAIVASTAARTMPPFAVQNDGSCNEFADARWLADEDIDLIAAWVDGGMVEGDPPAEPITPPVPPSLTGPGIASMTTPMYTPVPQTEPGEEYEDYQCFLVDPGLDAQRYVVGFEVVPGNASIVHHVLGFKVDPNAFGNAATMQALDDASPDQLGWDCLGAAGDNVFVDSVPVTWAPGVGAVAFPEGTGIPLGPDDVLVVQVHYNLANGEGDDATTVKLRYADEVDHPATQFLWDPFLYGSITGMPESLAPGLPSAKYAWDESFAGMEPSLGTADEIEIWGVLPHMHKRGRKMSVSIERAGEMMCGADVQRYDFSWQQAYFYTQPIVVGPQDRLHVTCDWDTTGDSEPVMPGFSTKQEMCLLGLYTVPR